MRVLLVHNQYQQAGGEDAVFEQEKQMLIDYGYAIDSFIVSNDSIKGIGDKLRTIVRTPHNPAMKRLLKARLAECRPDIVHIHNFFPLLTPAVHEAAAEAGVAVVQTLHNFRLLCAAATFLRGQQICEKCLEGTRKWGVIHRCYRNSFVGSAAIVALQNRAERERTWHRYVHRFIALTHFARDKMIAGGLPAARIAVKPNFVADSAAYPVASGRRGALFVGRLSPEKGLATLLEAWRQLPADLPLTIIGDGAEADVLKRGAPPHVYFRGRLGGQEVRKAMHEAAALIVPSIWYEGFPMTIVEAFASGLPVVASDIGSLGEIVKRGLNGATFAPGNAAELARTVREFFAEPRRLANLGLGARADFERNYSQAVNIGRLQAIYEDAMAEARHGAG